MEFLNKNTVLYAGLIQCIQRGTAKLLEEDGQGIFLKELISNVFMLAVEDIEIGKQWLKKHEDLNYNIIVVFQKELVDYVSERYGLKSILDCFQAVYMKSKPPILGGSIQILPAEEKDFKLIADNYDILSDVEIKQIIQRKELFIGKRNDTVIGFIGQHLEGSMGLLEILPQYRGHGYGTELEKYMIIHMLEKGLIPFCQVETDNDKSLRLQKKLGLTISDEHVYWLS